MTEETIVLTHRAQQRLMVLNALERSRLLMADAARLIGRSIRQVRRLRSAYRHRGPAALVHGNQGRPSPRRTDDVTRTRVVALAQTTYAGINHQHLTELLEEREALVLSRPTLHRILKEAGVRSPRRRRPPRHRRRRERMPQPGMLVLLDGSQHAWLEERSPRLVLLAAMDDATSEVLSAEFRNKEDAHGYLRLLRTMAQTTGLPLAVYSDRHGIFHRAPRTPMTLEEQLRGEPAPTQVGRVLKDLGIRWIPASSPQAKGRIERLFATFQDRLLAELRLAGVQGRDGANAFLDEFLPRYNARFAQPAADPTPAYRPWPPRLAPDTVFCFKYLRTVANDNTVALGPHQIQILPGPRDRSYAKARVEVHERLDGTIAVAYKNRLLASQSLLPTRALSVGLRARHLARPGSRANTSHSNGPRNDLSRRGRDPHTPPNAPTRLPQTRPIPRKPRPDHPWNRYAAENKRRKELKEGGVTFSRNT